MTIKFEGPLHLYKYLNKTEFTQVLLEIAQNTNTGTIVHNTRPKTTNRHWHSLFVMESHLWRTGHQKSLVQWVWSHFLALAFLFLNFLDQLCLRCFVTLMNPHLIAGLIVAPVLQQCLVYSQQNVDFPKNCCHSWKKMT